MNLFSQELFYSPMEIIRLTCRHILHTLKFLCIYMLSDKKPRWETSFDKI